MSQDDKKIINNIKDGDKRWREQNKDHIKAYFAGYYEKNKGSISSRRKSRYHSDPEYRAKCLKRSREYASKISKAKRNGAAA